MTSSEVDPSDAVGEVNSSSTATDDLVAARRWVIDLDGVMWHGSTTIDGSVDAARRLIEVGHQLVFFTNHAEAPSVKAARLMDMGVPGPVVMTSAEAAAHLCDPGDRVLALGEPGLTQVLSGAGVDAIDVAQVNRDGPVPDVDVVVVGASSDWDRARTGLVADAIRSGARFIATNDDPTYPFSGPLGPRLLPGAGALVAAVATAAGVAPVVAGKPNQAAADLVTTRFGVVDYVIGDRDDTDGDFARRLGARYVMVLSGVTSADEVPVDPAPYLVVDDFAAAVDAILGDVGSGSGR